MPANFLRVLCNRVFFKKIGKAIIITLLAFNYNPGPVKAQSNTDSLLTSLKILKEDTERVKVLNQLFLDFQYSDQLRAQNYLDQATEIAEKINFKSGLFECNMNQGFLAKDSGNYSQALFHFQISLSIANEINDNNGKAYSYNNIGVVHKITGNYPEALNNYFAALKIRESLGNKMGVAGCYGNIGIVYANQGDYKEALKNYYLCLKIMEEIGNMQGVAHSYNNIGLVQKSLGNSEEAIKNYFASLKIREEIGDKQGIAASYNNIGIIYSSLAQFDESLKYLFLALKINQQMQVRHGIGNSLINLAQTYSAMNKMHEAKEYYNQAIEILKELRSKEGLKHAYSGLMNIEKSLGNYKSAFEYFELYSLYKDSLYNEETKKKTIESKMNYEFEKKEALALAEQEKKDAIVLEEKEKQRVILLSTGAGLFLMVIFAGYIFHSLKTTRKQKQLIEVAHDEISVQKVVVEKKNEEIATKNKDLTDSIHYAQRIQQAILTSEEYLNQMFSALHFILFKPKDIVAGDFYWAHKTENGKRIWMAADCTGHGVPGAFMSMIGNSLLNEIVLEKNIQSPEKILDNMRIGIIKAFEQGSGSREKRQDGMDAAICVWDTTSNILSFSGANNSLYVIRNGKIIELEADSQPVGFFGEFEIPFSKKEIQLIKGDTLYTFTDGYSDQFGGPNGKKFKSKAFKSLLLSIQDKSMPEQKLHLDQTIETWRGNLEQVDDICVFGVKV